jgi:hypothetical protein
VTLLSTGQCLCGAVQFEMEYPAFWAWHNHSRASRLAHGAVYATYVGTWRKRFRITAGEREINRFEEKETGAVRSFCRRCGTPLIYERTRSRHMINIPRALFQSRTGRQPIYHIAIAKRCRTGSTPASRWFRSKAIPACSTSDPRREVAYRRPAAQHRSGGVVHDHYFPPPPTKRQRLAYAASHRCATPSTACGATHSQMERPSAAACSGMSLLDVATAPAKR